LKTNGKISTGRDLINKHNNAGHAAAANYPALLFLWVTKKTGEPWGLTFIARPYQEDTLLKMDLPLNKQQKLENYLKTINSFKIVRIKNIRIY
jgi:Asp-tRNA(Asn)/Glu-tRNA(Gln) amidotransferase A subunit family amidase